MMSTKQRGSDELALAGRTGMAHDGKKVKFMGDGDHEIAPSRVLHVRHLPPDTTESEVSALGAPFGRVVTVMLLRTRNQAFLEMADEAYATAVVRFYNCVSANVRGHPIFIQYSNHSELKTAQPAGVNPSDASLTGLAGGSNGAMPAGPDGAVDPNGPMVLHIMIDNMIYPVTLDVLHTIFAKFGTVLRIITFNKNGVFQSLIEYADGQSGSNAKYALDGQNIYDRCCTLRIEPSKLKTLTVKGNNERQRDFTRADAEPMPGPIGYPSVAGLLGASPGYPGSFGFGSPNSSMGYNKVSHGNMMMNGGSSVLLVSNLNEEAVSPHELFILFGVYGDVQRVKILYNKKDAALVQMANAQQAQSAQSYLNKVSLFGKEMHITISKHAQVSLPRDNQEDSGLTKDFSSSRLHRFKQPGSHNYQNIYPPSPCLHLSNIPLEITEQFLRDRFEHCGAAVVGFRWMSMKDENETKKDRRMALMQLGSTEHALQALVALHNFQLGEKRYLRVSFAKSPSL